MKSNEIRESFLQFFEKYGHQRVRSSSLIPAADPTLLFTNAGMVQFKDCFLGTKDPGYNRATTVQKCVRAGGKHNDLENVGFTPRHHTFFEMLGNFSFGNYFKKEAIAFAWELITKEWKLPKDRLRVTVYEKDDEALELWKAVGVAADRIERLGDKDNFWAMGETGPCGPCTEIHWDWGATSGSGQTPGTDTTGRFLEIWNLVFMQFERSEAGVLTPLPKPSVDTGAGLERLSAVLQGVFSNYDTDLFKPILSSIGERVGEAYDPKRESAVSMRVIADHLRAAVFLVSDGVVPSNEGRGYVLRRILRRAIRHGKKLGQEAPFIYELVPSVLGVLGESYPDIRKTIKLTTEVLREEELKFHETLHRGLGVLEDAFNKAEKEGQKIVQGETAFKLYDTFGFPLDLIQVMAAERGFSVDESGFDESMKKQRGQSGGTKQAGDTLTRLSRAIEQARMETAFIGYETLEGTSTASHLFTVEGEEQDTLTAGSEGYAFFPTTPFYAESGGQVGDQGALSGDSTTARIVDTFKLHKAFAHRIRVERGVVRKQGSYKLAVDHKVRQLTAVNHTATHLLHAALRKILGERVQQAGSLVDANRLRFDFTFPRAVTRAELKDLESMVNEEIQKHLDVNIEELSYDQAIRQGALAFFDEKYGDQVRVITVGASRNPFSVELCGGTHLGNISEVGYFKILSETSVASGTRRIEAVTSSSAYQYLTHRHDVLESIESAIGVKGEETVKRVEALTQEIKALQRAKEQLEMKLAQGGGATSSGKALWEKAEDIQGIRAVIEKVEIENPKLLRSLVDQVRDKLKTQVLVALAAEKDGRVSICLGISADLVGKWDAGKLIQKVTSVLGGTGGGKADFAQGGGTDPSKIGDAFLALKKALQSKK